MPLNLGIRPGTLGKCRTHGRELVPRRRGDIAERRATDRLAASLGEEPADSLPIPKQPAARRGDCPECLAVIGAAAVAYLHDEDREREDRERLEAWTQLNRPA